uniref:Uncharacterized protein n=1 Tax=Macaca fascicularis TaxID=9541 RepID=A0A7N9CD72_MACFA
TPPRPANFCLPASLCPEACALPHTSGKDPCRGGLAWALQRSPQTDWSAVVRSWGGSPSQQALFLGWDRKLKPGAVAYAFLSWSLA